MGKMCMTGLEKAAKPQRFDTKLNGHQNLQMLYDQALQALTNGYSLTYCSAAK
ncbi:MAG: hypothetical protein IJ125_02920 [Atopobiaceae bacterium]|nr:hypothetical protein [Atopobiaceae bacterium]